MLGVPPRGHLQGQTRDNSNTRFFHTKNEHMDMCSYMISAVNIYHILSKEIFFVFSYSTQRWNAYVAGKMKQAYNKDKARSIFLKS